MISVYLLLDCVCRGGISQLTKRAVKVFLGPNYILAPPYIIYIYIRAQRASDARGLHVAYQFVFRPMPVPLSYQRIMWMRN